MGEIASVTYTDSRKAIATLLKDTFSPNQLAMIESAFEDGYYNGYSHWSSNPDTKGGGIGGKLTGLQIDKVKKFANKYIQPRKRLIAIMSNIIANKGTFKP